MPTDQPLSVLGLSATQEAAYELLVDSPMSTVDELAGRWPYPEPLAPALAALAAAGLARATAGRYAPVPPRAAFDALLADGWRRLHREREETDRLARDRVSGGGAGPVEVVVGAEAVHEHVARAVASARREVRRLGAVGPEPPASVATRTIRPDPPAEPGHHVRTAGVPLDLCLVDDRLGLVPADGDRYGGCPALLVVHPSELLRALGLLFEALWERAGTPPARQEPDRLVGLLLTGLTDDAIGRALGVSTRTAQRRVGAMMAAAGARTRFQAGVQAALRAMPPPASPPR
ncbi:hypothetical protein [Phytohabitans rumicis]|uniref:HTH luxR-type domain-containing protein n=1 Tax=Phytohabitans rumicis TaxID=1076125 RepID=A0A6V8LQS6_9ACTN|nr:hypothetical protein [Phytohabitans rumicis]GFJ95075.1 hypothetical protein Prum_087170 [Phytohabitans rumicis]